MKRLYYLAVLMALSSSAYAENSISFVVGGHRIHIEAPRHCNSSSCVSVSIPGIYETRRRRDKFDDIDDTVAAPAKPPAPAVAPAPAVVPAPAPAPVLATVIPPAPGKPPIVPVAPAPPPPATVGLAASSTKEVAPPMPATPQPARLAPVTVSNQTPTNAARPALDAARPAPPLSRVSREADDEPAATPLGEWQTEGNKGSVRIEKCGSALCGFLLNQSSGSNAEVILINMKPKAASEWTGNIYSRDSGDTYYATMAMKGPNSLRVEACALGRFYCSGNVWNRIAGKPDKLMSYRQISSVRS